MQSWHVAVVRGFPLTVIMVLDDNQLNTCHGVTLGLVK